MGHQIKIRSDNGPHFINNIMKGIAKAVRIWHRLGWYYPQSQGMIERANDSLKAKITKMCADAKMN